MEDHGERVQVVVGEVVEWDKGGRKQNMRTARPNWSSMSTKLGSNKEGSCKIPVGHLDHILEIDEENMTITCEPGVNMGDITNVLLPRHRMVPGDRTDVRNRNGGIPTTRTQSNPRIRPRSILLPPTLSRNPRIPHLR